MIIAKNYDKTVFYDSYIHCKPLEIHFALMPIIVVKEFLRL